MNYSLEYYWTNCSCNYCLYKYVSNKKSPTQGNYFKILLPIQVLILRSSYCPISGKFSFPTLPGNIRNVWFSDVFKGYRSGILAWHCTKNAFNDFFMRCDQIRSFLGIWSHLLKKSLKTFFVQCEMD